MGRILDYVLGGSTSPMAGDGFGYSPSATRTAAKSPIAPPVIQVDVDSGIEEARASSSSNLRSPSLNPSPYGTNQTEHGSSQTLESSRVSPGPSRSPNGIRAPRCSLAISARVTEPVVPSRPSTDTFRTASEESATTEVPHVSGEVSWQEYEIPQELELVRDDTPAEIQNIVQESLDEHRVIRASILQSQVALKTNTISETGALRNADGPAIAECSAMASARSTPDSQYSTSSLGMTAESDTSIESDADDHERLKPASNSLGRPGIDASQENSHAGNAIHSSMTEMEQRFLESKLRSKKGHKLFRRRHDGNSTGEPSLDLPRAEPAISECTGCFEEFPTARTVGLPCRHKYCSPCFTQLITTSIEHEISFPPKCCLTEIPKKIIRDNLPTATRAIFDNKALEYAVPVGNRYYCVSSTCGRWIDTRHAKRKNGAIACQHCKVKLCALCRGPRHASNEECPQDFGLEKTLAQAERAGWRRCHNCRAMVEKNQGCRHITCKCGAQFW